MVLNSCEGCIEKAKAHGAPQEANTRNPGSRVPIGLLQAQGRALRPERRQISVRKLGVVQIFLPREGARMDTTER